MPTRRDPMASSSSSFAPGPRSTCRSRAARSIGSGSWRRWRRSTVTGGPSSGPRSPGDPVESSQRTATAMSTPLRPPKPVPPARAADYVAKGYWDDRQLRDGIEAAAASRPEVVAVADNQDSLSWVQLAARVGAGVGRLSAPGVPSGHAVLLISGNTSEGLIAYHSLLRAGVLTVLLDRRCGAADIRIAMQAAPVSTVIAAQSEIDRLGSELGTTTALPLAE